jgi:hypothetical protein
VDRGCSTESDLALDHNKVPTKRLARQPQGAVADEAMSASDRPAEYQLASVGMRCGEP